MSHSIPTYLLASSLIALGMNWWQAVLTIFLGNLIVLVPMVLNGHAGTQYGIPFPVFARASFGLRGANLPALLRALVACGWFGIQTWIGGEAFFILIGAVARARLDRCATPAFGGYPWTQWLSFAIFWVLEIGDHRARHGHAAPVRELGRPGRARRGGRPAHLHGDQGATASARCSPSRPSSAGAADSGRCSSRR